jgi:hypothetical protein
MREKEEERERERPIYGVELPFCFVRCVKTMFAALHDGVFESTKALNLNLDHIASL